MGRSESRAVGGRQASWGADSCCAHGGGAAQVPGQVLFLLSAPSSRFCGEKSQFVVASKNSKITVHFHSDQSYTDTGFLAEYLSYDSSDRE